MRGSLRPANRQARLIAILSAVLSLSACVGANVAVESTRLPVPVVEPLPITVGIHLPEALRTYGHAEKIQNHGTYTINVGAAQNLMFDNLASGLFAGHRFLERGDDLPSDVDAILVPNIKELQFSIPQQTKSDFFEVWVNYDFRLLTPDGTAIAQWPMKAYGRANARNYGLLEDTDNGALQEAARGALRDGMAVFTFKFKRVPAVAQWLQQFTASDTNTQSSLPVGESATAPEIRAGNSLTTGVNK